jgi:transposase InsO family protein
MTGLPRSTFYYRARTRTKQQADSDLRDEIETIALEFSKYGYRRITNQLKLQGWNVNHKRILRIMREEDLLVKPRRHWIKTTDSRHGYRIYPNLIQGVVVSAINQVWVSDITYIRILLGFVYLAVILDAYSRKVIGHHVSAHLDTDLTLQALRMAIAQRKPVPGTIHHSDQGVQYAATDYVQELQAQGFHISMSRKGNPYDNAKAESFFKTLKNEEVYLWDYETLADVQRRIPFFLEAVYNQKRLHSSLGYLPPAVFEAHIVKEQKAQNLNPLASGYSNLPVQP